MKHKKHVLFIYLIPIAGFSIASTFYFLQGGFGGGHGKFDHIIGISLLPALALDWMPSFLAYSNSDFTSLLLNSLINNLLLSSAVVLFYLLILKFGKIKRSPNE